MCTLAAARWWSTRISVARPIETSPHARQTCCARATREAGGLLQRDLLLRPRLMPVGLHRRQCRPGLEQRGDQVPTLQGPRDLGCLLFVLTGQEEPSQPGLCQLPRPFKQRPVDPFRNNVFHVFCVAHADSALFLSGHWPQRTLPDRRTLPRPADAPRTTDAQVKLENCARTACLTSWTQPWSPSTWTVCPST